MSRAVARIAVAAWALTFGMASSPAHAAGRGGGGGSGTGSNGEGFVWALAGLGHTTPAVHDSSVVGPVCRWSQYREVGVVGAGPVFRDVVSREFVGVAGPGVETLYSVVCPSGATFRWALPAEFVDRVALVDAVAAYVVRRVPVLSVVMSPSPEVGAVVNVGLWLAVADPGVVSAVAEAGPVWAAVTARLGGVSWEMGNGDVVECVGLGVAYPVGADTFEQGPCGYTYTQRPPVEGYTVTVTGRWVVRLVTSDGVDAALPSVEVPSSFVYDVDEIVTVGEAFGRVCQQACADTSHPLTQTTVEAWFPMMADRSVVERATARAGYATD